MFATKATPTQQHFGQPQRLATTFCEATASPTQNTMCNLNWPAEAHLLLELGGQDVQLHL